MLSIILADRAGGPSNGFTSQFIRSVNKREYHIKWEASNVVMGCTRAWGCGAGRDLELQTQQWMKERWSSTLCWSRSILGMKDHMTNKRAEKPGGSTPLEWYAMLLTFPPRVWFYCSEPSQVLGRCSEPIGCRISLMLNSRRIAR